MAHYAVLGDNREVREYQTIRTANGEPKLVEVAPSRMMPVPNNPEAIEHWFRETERRGLANMLNLCTQFVKFGHRWANDIADTLIDHFG